MKKIVLTLVLVVSLPFAYAGEYVKRDGVLSILSGNGTAKFSINASHGDASGVCNMEGIAESVEAGAGQQNRWVYSDSSSACVAVISEANDGSVNVITRSCDNYCGVSAVGSMDGKFKRK